MSFKIVMFLKRRKNSSNVEVAYIPESWEENGTIFWPNSNAEKLRQNPVNLPQENWFKYRGIVKKINIRSLDEAKLWEEEIINAENTEDERNIQITNTMKQAVNSSNKKFNNSSSDEENEFEKTFATIRNNTVEKVVEDCEKTVIPENILQVATGVDPPVEISFSSDLFNMQDVLMKGIENLSYEELKNAVLELKKQNEELKGIIYTMDSRIKTILAFVEKTYSKIDSIGNVNEITSEKSQINDNSALDNKFNFPINETETLFDFNRELVNNGEYKNFLVERFKKIGGTEGKADGQKVGRSLLSILITTEILTKYSWTGISRTAGVNKKLPFQSFDGIINLFGEIIGKADCKWSEHENIKFFKSKILKHANKINETFEKNKNKKLVAIQANPEDLDLGSVDSDDVRSNSVNSVDDQS